MAATIDDVLDWGALLQKERDLLREGVSLLLANTDPNDPDFTSLADLYCITDPGGEDVVEIERRHGAMLAEMRLSVPR